MSPSLQRVNLPPHRLHDRLGPLQIRTQPPRSPLADPVPPLDTAEQHPDLGRVPARLRPFVHQERHHEHLQGDEMCHEQLGRVVVDVDEDGELVVAHVEEGAVEADEAEVAGLGGVAEGEAECEQGGVEAVVHGCAEEGLERLRGEDGRGDEGRVEGGHLLEPGLHQAQVDILFDVEGCVGLVAVDLLGDEGAAADHGDEVGHAVAHVRRLEGEGVAGSEEGIRFAVVVAAFGERFVQAFDRLAAVHDGDGAVVTVGGYPGEVRGTQRKERVHQIVMLGEISYSHVFLLCGVSATCWAKIGMSRTHTESLPSGR